MEEMEVDLNLKHDWSMICEAGETLERLRGPGLVGLRNLGNSCYLNATVQLVLAIPEFGARYADAGRELRRSAPDDIAGDLVVAQVAKLTNCLLTERYLPPLEPAASEEQDPALALAPYMFRRLVGRGHPEFSSDRQQMQQSFCSISLRCSRALRGPRLPLGACPAAVPSPPCWSFRLRNIIAAPRRGRCLTSGLMGTTCYSCL